MIILTVCPVAFTGPNRRTKVLMAVDPSKDVDGFHPENFGKWP
jgi:5,10-methylene-tetrahydrofolate dehydrogenase/methenyl tetrahydrofolate cyclohydrolase